MTRDPIDIEALFREVARRGGDGARPAPPRRTGPPRIPRSAWLVAALILLVGAVQAGAHVLTQWWWFRSLGLADVYRLRLVAPWAMFVAAFLLGFAWLAGHAFWALRAARGPLARRSGRRLALGVAVAVAALIAAGLAGSWELVALWRNQQAFGRADPLFGRDVGFYLWTLPLLRLAQTTAWSWLLGAAGLAGAFYALGGAASARDGRWNIAPPARRHLLGLGALGALLWAAGQWLARFELLFVQRQSGAFFGPGHADATARLLAQNTMVAVGIATAIALIVGARMRRLLPIGAVVGTALVLQVVLGIAYPAAVQRFQVAPNELAYESPYIEHNLAFTRAAFGLDDVSVVDYAPDAPITQAVLDGAEPTLRNVRLWDWRTLQATFRQLQEIRQYYEFLDVDVDRYALPGEVRQVLLSARELTPDALPNRTWVNLHLKFTHGYGAVVTPVDEVDPQGLPVLWQRDIPPVVQAPFDRPITEPRLYFGEADLEPYVIVGTRTGEFSYPSGQAEGNATTTYAGQDGVGIGGRLQRVLFAARFGEPSLLLSDEVRPESRILLYRNIRERAEALAPFLAFDRDPYLVIDAGGRLVWMLDAYTHANRYPYAESVATGDVLDVARVNYLRNSVKVTIDAYDGRPAFWVVDPHDPVVNAWRGVYPTLFHDAAGMPADLVAHWRYPEALFRVQSSIYSRYHMRSAGEFYNGEDVWVIPTEAYAREESHPVDPYYVNATLRGETEPEFILMRPFAPKNRQNLTAWMAGRSDPAHYGELVVYRFPKGRQFYGTQQVESRIDQDTEISQQLTLWGQGGSNVIRGNLLVIPLGDSLLYVEPLYLQAESSTGSLPELKRVIVADAERVAMAETLQEALDALVHRAPNVAETSVGNDEGADADDADGDAGAGGRPPAPTREAGGTEDETEADIGAPTPASGPVSAVPADLVGLTIAELVAEAENRQQAAASALARGDWTTFGREMDALQAALDRLGEVTGGEGAEAVPTATGAAAP